VLTWAKPHVFHFLKTFLLYEFFISIVAFLIHSMLASLCKSYDRTFSATLVSKHERNFRWNSTVCDADRSASAWVTRCHRVAGGNMNLTAAGVSELRERPTVAPCENKKAAPTLLWRLNVRSDLTGNKISCVKWLQCCVPHLTCSVTAVHTAKSITLHKYLEHSLDKIVNS
jgi:hypothetical protein